MGKAFAGAQTGAGQSFYFTKRNQHRNTNMPKLNEVFSGNYLKAEDLKGRNVRVTIDKVIVKDFDDGKKIILTFHGKDKSLVCNKTNASIIQEVLGSDDTDDWEGQSVTLTTKKVEFKGDLVPAIRVLLEERPAPPPPKPATPPVDDDAAPDDIPFNMEAHDLLKNVLADQAASKQCFKCKHTKPLCEFYVHRQMADGHLNKCKECTKQDMARRYASPEGRAKVREYERARFRFASRKESLTKYQEARRRRSPEKYRARSAVNNAVRTGRLVRGCCQVCGAADTQAHHADYSQPLEIQWLCFKHHREIAHGQHVG